MVRALKYFLFLILFSPSFAQQRTIDSLITYLPSIKDDTTKVNALNQLANESIGLSKFDEAVSYAGQAIKLSAKIEFLSGEAWANHYIGNVYFYKNDLQGSLKYYFTCLELREKWLRRDPENKWILNLIAAACVDIGYVYDYLSDYPKAHFYYLRALEIAEKTGNYETQISSQTNIASIYHYQGELDKALEYNFRSMKMNIARNRKKGLGISYNNIGNVYYDKKDLFNALKYHKLGLKVKRERGEPLEIASSLNNIGNVFCDLSDYRIDSLRLIFPSLIDSRSLLDTAELYLKEALAICNKAASVYGMMQVNKTLGNVSLKKHKLKEALGHYKIAVAYGDSLNTQKELYESYRNMAEIYSSIGSYGEAFKYQKLYSDLKDTVFNEIKEKDLGRQEARFEFDKKLIEQRKEQEKKDAVAEESKRRQNFVIASVSVIALLLMIFALFIMRSYRQKQKANIEILQQKMIIEEKSKEVHDSITYAKRIQSAILPPDKLFKANLPDSFILFKPKDIVSGDFYWMETADDKILFAAVDCTGHGVPGAMVSVVGHSSLNRAVKEFGLTQPAAILDKLTELVEETFSKSENEVKDGMDISLCCYHPKTKILEWAGANNPLWILKNQHILEIKADKQPIGSFEHRKPFTNHIIQLSGNERIYIFTDGYADQFGGEKGKKFKYIRLKDLIISNNQTGMKEQKQVFDSELIAWQGSMEQVDDVLVIGVSW